MSKNCRIVLLIVACAATPSLASVSSTPIQASIDVGTTYQTMDGWGSSMINFDSANATSVYTSDAYRNAFRDLGLNILRVQMTKDVLTAANNGSTVLLDPTNVASNVAQMNFNADEIKNFGSMASWLSQNALEPGRVQITGASWSPPQWMKVWNGKVINGQSYTTDANGVKKPYVDPSTGNSWGGTLNVHLNDDDDRNDPNSVREQFGTYLGSWVKGFEQAYGVKMSAINIQNEPNIETAYDSMALNNVNGADNPYVYGKALSGVADAWGKLKDANGNLALSGVKVMGAGTSYFGDSENTLDPQHLYGLTSQREMMATAGAYGVQNFTSIDAANFYNNVLDANAMKVLAAYYHGAVEVGHDADAGVSKDAVAADWNGGYIDSPYFSTNNGTYVPGIEADGKKVWYTESSEEDPSTWLNNTGSTPTGAMTVGLKMFDALVYSNAASYQYWQLADTNAAVSEYTLLGDNDLSDPTKSKKYDAFKQFSRYIRPGAIRVAATFNATGTASTGSTLTNGDAQYDSAHSLNIAAFVQPEDKTFTMVLLNMLADDQTVTIAVPFGDSITSYQAFTTDANDNFLQLADVPVIDGSVTFDIGGDAILTLYGTVPEPGSATIFSAGVLALLARRRAKRELATPTV